MSVLVKGMEMPTRCFSYPMCDVENAEVNCAVSHGSYIEYREVDPKVAIQERPSWCPLIELQSHGDLIDRDALKLDFLNRGIEGIQTDDFSELQQTIDDAPTILPASEVE